MSIILLCFATATAVHTARVSVISTNNDDDRPIIPVTRYTNMYRTSNGLQFVPSYVYSRNNGTRLSDVLYQERGVNFNHHSNGQWASRINYQNTVFNNGNARNPDAFDYVKRQINEETQGNNKNYELNNRSVDVSSHINTRSYDANDEKLTSTPRVNDTETEESSTNRSHTSVNNDKTGNNNHNNTKKMLYYNTNKNISTNVNSTKSSQGNEVTTAHVTSGDKWVWSDDEKKLETTTLPPLDDRAAFDGNGCPNGQTRFNGVCVVPD